jgi:hypothetical protein
MSEIICRDHRKYRPPIDPASALHGPRGDHAITQNQSTMAKSSSAQGSSARGRSTRSTSAKSASGTRSAVSRGATKERSDEDEGRRRPSHDSEPEARYAGSDAYGRESERNNSRNEREMRDVEDRRTRRYFDEGPMYRNGNDGRSGGGYGEERYRQGGEGYRGDDYRNEGRMGYREGRDEGYGRQRSSYRSYDDNGRYSSQRGESGDRLERSQWERGAYGNGNRHPEENYDQRPYGERGGNHYGPNRANGGWGHPDDRGARNDWRDTGGSWSNGGYRERDERRYGGYDQSGRNEENARYQHSDTQGWDRPGNGYERYGGAGNQGYRYDPDRYPVEEARGMGERGGPRVQEEERYGNRYQTRGRMEEDRYRARSGYDNAEDGDTDEGDEENTEA